MLHRHTPIPKCLKQYNACTNCSLFLNANRNLKPLFGGEFPCSTLFVHDHPNIREKNINQLGFGDSGDALKETVERVIDDLSLDPETIHLGYTSVLACMPSVPIWKEESNTNGTAQQAEACRPRLRDIFLASQASSVVLMGSFTQKHARKAFPDHWKNTTKIPTLHISSPKYWVSKGLGRQEHMAAYKALRTFFAEQYLSGKSNGQEED